MKLKLDSYIPTGSVDQVSQLLQQDGLVVKVNKERKTRHGDYKQLPNGKHQITVNANLNQYRFLVTLIHEIAHLEAYKNFGNFIKPHGKEWKYTFQRLMLPFLNPTIFPNDLLPLLAQHFKNPKASSDTDSKLALALRRYDEPNGKTYVFELPIGSKFQLYNGKIFEKGERRVKRFECIEVRTGRLYLFNPNAEVVQLNTVPNKSIESTF